MNAPPDERTVELFRDNFAAAHASAERLARSMERLAPLFPIGAEHVARLDPEQEDALDALLHRFTNLLALVQDRLFRAAWPCSNRRLWRAAPGAT